MRLFRFIGRLIRFVLLLALAVLIVAGALLGWLGHREYVQALEKCPIVVKQAQITAQENYTALDCVPDTYIKAVVAVEDSRFYKHRGVDPLALLRAVRNNFRARELREGGSTITQQLCKNIYFTQEASAVRKSAEIFMALRMEKELSKDEILELYVNSIYFGSGYYCIHDAAEGYFGKLPAEMDDYESTLLAGIPNAPSIYSLDVNPQLARERQHQVLMAMVSEDIYTLEEAEAIFSSHD